MKWTQTDRNSREYIFNELASSAVIGIWRTPSGNFLYGTTCGLHTILGGFFLGSFLLKSALSSFRIVRIGGERGGR